MSFLLEKGTGRISGFLGLKQAIPPKQYLLPILKVTFANVAAFVHTYFRTGMTKQHFSDVL
jgi:hypothetical protein